MLERDVARFSNGSHPTSGRCLRPPGPALGSRRSSHLDARRAPSRGLSASSGPEDVDRHLSRVPPTLWVIFYAVRHWAQFPRATLSLGCATPGRSQSRSNSIFSGRAMLVLLARVTASRARLLGAVVAGVGVSVSASALAVGRPGRGRQDSMRRLDWRGESRYLVGSRAGRPDHRELAARLPNRAGLAASAARWPPPPCSRRRFLGACVGCVVHARGRRNARWRCPAGGADRTRSRSIAARRLDRADSSPSGTPGARTGRISYGLYLWHFPIYLRALRARVPKHPPGAIPASCWLLSVTFLVAEASFRFPRATPAATSKTDSGMTRAGMKAKELWRGGKRWRT